MKIGRKAQVVCGPTYQDITMKSGRYLSMSAEVGSATQESREHDTKEGDAVTGRDRSKLSSHLLSSRSQCPSPGIISRSDVEQVHCKFLLGLTWIDTLFL